MRPFQAGFIKRKFQNAPISHKIFLVCVASSGVSLALLSGLFIWQDVDSHLDRQEQLLESLAAIVEANSEAAIAFGDPRSAAESLQSLAAEREIQSAHLFDADGEIFASYVRLGSSAPPIPFADDRFVKRGDNLYCSIPVSVSDKRLGTLQIVSHVPGIRETILASLPFTVITFGLGLLLIAVIVRWAQRPITAPIVELRNLAEHVTREEDFSRRATSAFQDEMGSLVQSFNFMLEHIQQNQEELRTSHRNLERQVQARTAELRAALESAEAASASKSRFLATMSHELRTPLNAIIGVCSYLLHKESDMELVERIEIIQRSADNLLNLIRDVLDFSKIEAGRLDLEIEPQELLPIIDSAVQIAASQKSIPDSVVVFSTVNPKIPGIIDTDRFRLRQVLVNLLGNGIKFTERGHVWLDVDMHLREDGSRCLCFSVQDTGIGIPEERRGLLFSSFTQIDDSPSRRYEGTGLGLVICQKITHALGGSIEVESTVGKGSTFRLWIPYAGNENGEPIASNPPWPVGKKPDFLIGAFPTPLRNGLIRWIEYWGADCHLSPSGQALQLAAVHPNNPSDHRLVDIPVKWPWAWSSIREGLQRAFCNGTPIQPAKPSPSPMDFSGMNLNILLVEDNVVNQRVFQLVIGRLGLKASVVSGGKEALDLVNSRRWDLLFIDYQMPGMDGTEVAAAIRALGDQIHQPYLIGFSANVQDSAINHMRAAGMDDFLPKPVKVEDLAISLEIYVQRKRALMPS